MSNQTSIEKYHETINLSLKDIKPMNMQMKPKKEHVFLTPIAWTLSFITTFKRKLKINKVNMEGLKPPYLLLCTHHSFDDFKVQAHAIFPYRATYVIAVDGFLRRERLLRHVGGIPKRKFTPQDLQLYKHIKYSLENLKKITTLYPEAAYSIIGTNAILPDSLAKIIMNLKVPVVTLNMHGNFLNQPVFMSKRKRKVPITADMTQVLSANEIGKLSIDEVKHNITNALTYDEWKYQLDNNIIIDDIDRAEGLEKVLYQCQNCLTEYQMESKGIHLWCNVCGEKHTLNTLGQLENINKETKYSHIPDWYEAQRVFTRIQLLNNTYNFNEEVIIESLRNAKGFIRLPDGHLTHSIDALTLTGIDLEGPLSLTRETKSLYSVHIEFNYRFRTDKIKSDAIIISSLTDSYYCYPKQKLTSVVKLRFAIEEAYKLKNQK